MNRKSFIPIIPLMLAALARNLPDGGSPPSGGFL